MDDTNTYGLGQVLEMLTAALVGPQITRSAAQAEQGIAGRWIETAHLAEAAQPSEGEESVSEVSGQWTVGGGGLPGLPTTTGETVHEELHFASIAPTPLTSNV